MRRLILSLCLALPIAARADDACREDSYCDVDLSFTDSAHQPALCPTFDYQVNDVNSGKVLLAKTTEASPGSKPCPRKCTGGTNTGDYCIDDAGCPPGTSGLCALQAGCATVRLPPATGGYVGKCVAPPPKKDQPCTSNAECAPGTCSRSSDEVTQPHVLTGVCQPGTGQQYTFHVDVPVQNLRFVPLP